MGPLPYDYASWCVKGLDWTELKDFCSNLNLLRSSEVISEMSSWFYAFSLLNLAKRSAFFAASNAAIPS